ncbi:UNVERIFIED_CONTAM: hypothetical protein Sradi_1096600 [Sesamum radiatum]|uniref:Reverse transcriptase zinc-binding domain-containing protein n=1 Tax=Sesamum radiatum TaxID=300843 RepID=A0AAW2V993_SESRA
MFSVRNAYNLACTLEDRPCSSSLHQNEHSWWRRLWQAKLPNKIKVFIWRACSNAIPTGKSLASSIPSLTVCCPFCKDCEEDVLHTMVLCPFARQVWGCAPFHLVAVRIGSMGFREWLTAVSVQFDEIDFQLLLGLCWSIWWCRNGLAMNGNCLDPPQVVCFVSQYLSSFRTQNSDDQRQVTPKVPSSWLAPPPGYVKINFDGATFNNSRVLGVGVVARGSSGECLAWISKRFQRMGDGEMAEAMAARETILLAKRKNWPSVIFKGDCATLIDKILAPVVDLSAIGPIVADIRSSATDFCSISFQFVRRSCNSVAHALAHSVCDYAEGVSVVLVEVAPYVFAEQFS